MCFVYDSSRVTHSYMYSTITAVLYVLNIAYIKKGKDKAKVRGGGGGKKGGWGK